MNYQKQPSVSSGTAKRVRNLADNTPNIIVMATVICDDCGARFAIRHPSAFEDADLARRQAVWLADKFVWDHIQENKHPNSIPLPGSHDITRPN